MLFDNRVEELHRCYPIMLNFQLILPHYVEIFNNHEAYLYQKEFTSQPNDMF